MYKHVAITRPKCISALYHIDQSDSFISLLYYKQYISCFRDVCVNVCLLALANNRMLTIVLAVEETDIIFIHLFTIHDKLFS